MLIDPSDTARCTPLNPLALSVDDPVAYVGLRDRIVDDLLDTFDAIYDLKTTGGPMFEQCFRTFMSLLMGGRPQRGYTPTLPLLGVLMADTGLQKFLEVALRGDDPVTLATLDQIRSTTGDSALTNMLPYLDSADASSMSGTAVGCTHRDACLGTQINNNDVVIVPERDARKAAPIPSTSVAVFEMIEPEST